MRPGTPRRPALLSAAGLAVFIGAWEAAVRSGVLPASLVPAPSAIPQALIGEIRNGSWFTAIGESLGHYLIGVCLGSLLGIVAGAAVALLPRFAAVQAWIARLLRPIPPLAWIPFTLIWFGPSQAAAAFIIGVGVFWLNYFATWSAVETVDEGLVELAAAFGQGGFARRLGKVILPAALPGMLSGVRSGLGQGWMAVVAAELFGIPGIGQRMNEAAGVLATNVLVLYMLTIALLYGMTDLMFERVTRRFLAWTRA
ncbi:MAG TPA: ABC transporter permease [Acidiphilium sp.]|uniref:ABC transporter permease n=1 Tax=unclassified Acidiphilium TaxID=2617493 RepID=UPI000BC41B11|nr:MULTISPECIES: ABC transporter permease [unclassified Acidiphilium]OYV56572.1 MAG: nitrate ABC transporter permease [Acidiphilium sp. 20-67-58]HQT62046.1 ABC transporter permease [Acidiphilium sp.]HQU11609.1 ABC transporter permease [Acidiphilium sp.]